MTVIISVFSIFFTDSTLTRVVISHTNDKFLNRIFFQNILIPGFQKQNIEIHEPP